MSPNIVAARFIQLAPAYTSGPVMADGATIGLDRTAVPVEWDEVKSELTKLSHIAWAASRDDAGPLSEFVNQAADTFDGNGDSFRKALRELSQTAGRLGDSRTDLFGTVKNLQILINALSKSNEQIVQFSGHLASVSQVLADSSTNLDDTLGTLNQALSDVRGFLADNNSALISQVDKLSQLTKLFADQHDDLEQLLHVTPNGLANFYNIYDPAQGTATGLLSLPNFANPVQFICGGVFEGSLYTDNIKRAEICRERMAPVLRRLAMNYPPILLHPINTMTAYKGQIIYDTPATEAKAQTYIPYLQWIPSQGRQPPRSGDTGVDSLMLPPNPVPGPPPPAQPQFLQACRGPRRRRRRAQLPARVHLTRTIRLRVSRRCSRLARSSLERADDVDNDAAIVAIPLTPELCPHGGNRLRDDPAGWLPVRWAELTEHAGYRRPWSGRLQHHGRGARCRNDAAELAGDGRRRHGRQRVGRGCGATVRRQLSMRP